MDAGWKLSKERHKTFCVYKIWIRHKQYTMDFDLLAKGNSFFKGIAFIQHKIGTLAANVLHLFGRNFAKVDQ